MTQESKPNMGDTEEFNSNNDRSQVLIQGQRTMRKFLNLPKVSTPSCFAIPLDQNHVII